jgi:hypothetical protein
MAADDGRPLNLNGIHAALRAARRSFGEMIDAMPAARQSNTKAA